MKLAAVASLPCHLIVVDAMDLNGLSYNFSCYPFSTTLDEYADVEVGNVIHTSCEMRYWP